MSMSTTSLEPGEEIWRFQEGSSGSYEVTYAASADADGNFFLAGLTSGSIDGLVDNEGEHDLAAMKIDVNGELLWTWQEGSAGDELFSSAAATDDGGVVLAGYSNGTFNGVASEGLTDFLAVKLDADGDVEWYWQQEGTDGEEDINACSKTTDGNVVLSGTTSGDWYGVNSGYNAWVAVKLDVTDGSVIWRYQASLEDLGTIPFASAARADGSIVLAGASDGPWEGSADTPYGVVDLCAVALDEDGGELWRWQDGVAYGYSYISGATALADDSVVLVGNTDASYAVTNSGGDDFLAVKVSSSGVTDWRWQSGTENDDYMTGVATGIDGTTVVLGGYTFGSWVEIQAGDTEDIDMVGISFNTDGDQLWTYQAGTNKYDYCGTVAVRPTDGAALLAGYSQGTWDGTTNYYSHAAGALLETGAEEGTVSPVLSFTPSPVLATTTPAPLVVVTSSPLFSATPSPSGMASPIAGTLSPQPAAPTDGSLSPSTACGEGDPFRIVSTVLPGIQGCFEITSESYASGASSEIFTTDGVYGFEKIWVFGTLDGTEGTSPYYVSYASTSTGQFHAYCYTEELSTDIHPADGTWTCIAEPDGDAYIAAEDEVKFQCGCAGTPAPASPTLAPVSTPVPVAAPVVVAEEEASSSSSSSVPLGAVIGGTLAGVVFLAIVAIFMVKRRARGDESFGRPPAAPASSAGVAADVAAGAAGKGAGVAPPPPPPDYSEPSPLEAEPAPVGLPPPPYSEPPPYSA
ncbi:unnamed protein product [Scytosiphon promiscuus]